MKLRYVLMAVALILLVTPLPAQENLTGRVKIGWNLVDREGNRSVDQGTFNLYQGGALDLENFRYRFDNGISLRGNLRSILLPNRNLTITADKRGVGGVTVHHDGYRRSYNFDGDIETKRFRTNARAWVDVTDRIRVTAGGGVTSKSGESLELTEPVGGNPLALTDFQHTFYQAGVTYRNGRRIVRATYHGSNFANDIDSRNDRNTMQIRVTGSDPMPGFERLVFNAGYQYYQAKLTERGDTTLDANTLWGGARLFWPGGWTFEYSIFFDRAERESDVVATDQITQAFTAAKTFGAFAGLSAGYRFGANDDLFTENSDEGFNVAGWVKPIRNLTLRAGYGIDNRDLESGVRALGKRESSRGYAIARYRTPFGWVRAAARNRTVDYDDIGSSTEYMSGAFDAGLNLFRYGQFRAAYSYRNGEFENAEGMFEFSEHLVSGEVETATYWRTNLGFGGSYLRSRQDIDIERFSVRFFGRYALDNGIGLEAEYRAVNFDDFNDITIPYTQYLTENIVRVVLTYDLR